MTEKVKNWQGVVFGLESMVSKDASVKKYIYPNLLVQLAIKNSPKFSEHVGLVAQRSRPATLRIIGMLGLNADQFHEIVTAREYQRGGEDPERFSLMAERLGLGDQPDRIAVLEAQLENIRAAKAAGCYVVGMGFYHAWNELHEAGADIYSHGYLHASLILDEEKSQRLKKANLL